MLLADMSRGIMFWSVKKHDKIKVEFIEKGKDKPFAVSMVPIGQLPATFEISTMLDIGDKKWSVVDALPKTKAEFEQAGLLRVILTPVQMVNPQNILFSLPSINDRMCALKKANSLDGMLVIHEDDWRQVEFISESLIGDIEVEILSIKNVYETKRKGVGFTGMHIRKLIETPMLGAVITYPELKSHFSVFKEYNSFGVNSCMGIAEHGFAFETRDGLRFYGVLGQDGNIQFLCLANANGVADKCGNLMRAFHLVCVDWCKMDTVR